MQTATEMLTIVRNLIAGNPIEEESREAAESVRYKSMQDLLTAEKYYYSLKLLEDAGTPIKIDPATGMPVSAGEISQFTMTPGYDSEECY